VKIDPKLSRLDSADPDGFSKLLDEQTDWPSKYTFKFIVPKAELATLERILDGYPLQQRPSRKGNYVAVTCAPMMSSSDEVMSIYERASKIKGIVSL
jgi:putative lipoic acid-binding regulatory protein